MHGFLFDVGRWFGKNSYFNFSFYGMWDPCKAACNVRSPREMGFETFRFRIFLQSTNNYIHVWNRFKARNQIGDSFLVWNQSSMYSMHVVILGTVKTIAHSNIVLSSMEGGLHIRVPWQEVFTFKICDWPKLKSLLKLALY
jgi:hypothetical protein